MNTLSKFVYDSEDGTIIGCEVIAVARPDLIDIILDKLSNDPTETAEDYAIQVGGEGL